MPEPNDPSTAITLDLLCTDPDRIERMWYIPTLKEYRDGWLLYSEELVLSRLQGCFEDPSRVQYTLGWRLVGGLLRGVMGLGQALLMILSFLPVISWMMYCLARSMPRNAVGFFMRACYWKSKLRRLGVDTFIDQGVEITRPDKVEIGHRCHIDRNVLMSVGSDDGYIRIGDYTFIGPSCHLAGRGGVEIGRCVGLAARVHLYSVSNLPYHGQRLGELVTMSHSVPADLQNTITGRLEIGDYTVIGMGSLVLPKVTLGCGAIVHPYAEVRNSFPKFSIVSGHGRARRVGWRRPARLDPRLHEAIGSETRS
ncbi:MAG: acyltransferase [Planctomycetes bacterium]|nr:acyltransferase [Planctomycetota bacterium]